MTIMDIVVFVVKWSNAGKAQLLQHSTKKKYKEAIKHSRDKKQTKLPFHINQVGMNFSTACTTGSI